MGNVLSDDKKQQVVALGRLGWSLRRIEEATAVRRETVSGYLRAAANGRRTARKMDYSDIPESSPEQLKAMRRVGRPPLGEEARQLIAIRVVRGVLDQFRKEARRRCVGYQTLINEVLAQHVRKDVA